MLPDGDVTAAGISLGSALQPGRQNEVWHAKGSRMQLSRGVIAIAVLFCVASAGIVLSGMFFIMMIGEVNRKKSEGEQISYWGATPTKLLRILHEYRKAYPGGSLGRYALATFWIGTTALAGIAVCARLLRS